MIKREYTVTGLGGVDSVGQPAGTVTLALNHGDTVTELKATDSNGTVAVIYLTAQQCADLAIAAGWFAVES